MKFTFPKILFIAAFFYSVFIICNQFSFFGLSYDESLFINAAIQKDEITFISKHWHGIPIMVMEYIGALKSWVYYPIFNIFGVNIFSIRLPMVVLMYVNFYLIYIIGVKYFNKTVILGLIILLFTDFTFINLHKIDHGPSAIETFLKLFCFYFISRKVSYANCLIIFLILILGVFNKLNFIWFANALFGTYFVFNFINLFNFTDFKAELKNSLNKIFIFNFGLYLLIVAFFVFLIKFQNITPNQPANFAQLFDQIGYQYHLMLTTFLNMRYQYLVGFSFHLPAIYNPLTYYSGFAFIVLILIINIVWIIKKYHKSYSAHFQVFTLIILIALQYVYTKEASNMWHILLLYPFVQLIVLNSIYIISKKFTPDNKLIFGLFVALWVGYNCYTYYDFQKKIVNNCNFWLYDPTIYKLIDYTQNRPENMLISLGYGIHSQLLVLDKKGKSYLELIGSENEANFIDMLNYNPKYLAEFNNTLVVENIKSNLNLKRENYTKMEESLAIKGFKLELLKEINDGCDEPLYNVFKVYQAK